MTVTPESLKADAEKAEKAMHEAVARGDMVEAGRQMRQAAYYQDLAKQLGAGAGLTVKPVPRTVKQVTPQQREAISKKLTQPGDVNMKAARKAGIPSLRQLAERLGVTASFLSQVRSGTRPMPAHLAAKFKALTGRDWQ